MATIARPHPWKHQLRSIMIVSILFALVAMAALSVQGYRAFNGSSAGNLSQGRYPSVPAAPAGSSSGTQTGRMQNNPFLGLRNVGNVP
jgi:hypothetical protein